jgi:hypothetical protein
MAPSVLFLLGMPRSGTKLLRDLLNRHQDVAIFPHESHFFVPLRDKLGKYGDVTNWDSFSVLYADFKDATFFRRMRVRGQEISADSWFRELQGPEFGDLLQALFVCYSKLTGCRIVGDKTPSYITQLSLLGSACPTARFIHIIRDPRDYALSMRKAWHKDVPRATQRWKQSIRKCQSDAAKLGLTYIEVRYEDLISAPNDTLSRICDFVGISFDENMLVLNQPSENLGDTQGAMSVVRDNYGKWRRQLEVNEVQQIESIAGAFMIELGYPPLYNAGDQDLSRGRMTMGQVLDALHIAQHKIMVERGIVAGLKQMSRDTRFTR